MLHGTALVVGEAGVLIRGASGAGKTTLALQLVHAAARRGLFARLVGDDRIALAAVGARLIMRPHPAIAGLVERRWQGIEPFPHEPAAVLALVVDLVDADRDPLPRLPEPADRTVELTGFVAPRLALPVTLDFFAQTARVFDALSGAPPSTSGKSPIFGPC